jgi:hypothetical protein
VTVHDVDALQVYADSYADAPPSLGQVTFPGRWRVEARVRMPRQQSGCRYWATLYRLARVDGLAPGGVAEEVLLEASDFLSRFRAVGEEEEPISDRSIREMSKQGDEG